MWYFGGYGTEQLKQLRRFKLRRARHVFTKKPIKASDFSDDEMSGLDVKASEDHLSRIQNESKSRLNRSYLKVGLVLMLISAVVISIPYTVPSEVFESFGNRSVKLNGKVYPRNSMEYYLTEGERLLTEGEHLDAILNYHVGQAFHEREVRLYVAEARVWMSLVKEKPFYHRKVAYRFDELSAMIPLNLEFQAIEAEFVNWRDNYRSR